MLGMRMYFWDDWPPPAGGGEAYMTLRKVWGPLAVTMVMLVFAR